MNENMTKACDDFRAWLTGYVDQELSTQKKRDLVSHLQHCDTCRDMCKQERWFLQSVRKAAPLYPISSGLRERVIETLSGLPTHVAVEPQRSWVANFAVSGSVRWLSLGLAMTVATVITALFFWHNMLRSDPSEFALMAVDAHQRHQYGQLPLELISTEPETVSAWFTDKVPFQLRLPHYRDSSKRPQPYQLQGGRLVGFQQDYAAYLAYRMEDAHLISLVITSKRLAQPWGQEQLATAGLLFHYDTIEGLKVITWSHRGLVYALVSDLAEHGQQSCLVCHHNFDGPNFLRTLEPVQHSL